MAKFAEVPQQQRATKDGAKNAQFDWTKGPAPAWRFSWEKWFARYQQEILIPRKKCNVRQASQPTSWCQERSKRGELAYSNTVSRNPIIQIIQSVCHYDMRHTQSKLLNLPSNLLSEPCKYCLSVLLHLMKLQFLQKLWLLYSKFFANSLRFQRFSSSCEHLLSQSRIKLDFQETHPPTKKISKRSFLSYIQKFPLRPCHHSLLSQTCS